MARRDRLDWFAAAERVLGDAVTSSFDLMVEARLQSDMQASLREATIKYLGSSLQAPGARTEEVILRQAASDPLAFANRTPNGLVLPKREIEDRFNELHALLAVYVRGLKLDDLVQDVICPVMVRLQLGVPDPVAEARPLASTKIHSDIWAGDPGDNVVIFIPILGDIGRTTVEYFEVPDDFEERGLKVVQDYDEAAPIVAGCRPLPLELRQGYVYLVDAIVPHRTVNRGGGPRVTLEFRLRRRTSHEERLSLDHFCDPGRLSHYIPLEEWYSIGRDRWMRFADTLQDARRGVYPARPYNEKTYTLIDPPSRESDRLARE